jgi:DnaJ domain
MNTNRNRNMNTEVALEIFNIDVYEFAHNANITNDFIKKRYHTLALQYHPDKNGNTAESKERFQEINEAYSFLSKELGIGNKKENTREEQQEEEDGWENVQSSSYANILQDFLTDFMKNGIYSVYVKEILFKGCQNISKKVDKETALEIYEFLSKYKKSLHISNDIIQTMKDIVLEKYKNDNVYILNPSLNELLGNQLCYKLVVDEKRYYVPLWHNELYFDSLSEHNKNAEIIVKCIPEIPENMYIDEENNLYINIEIPFSMVTKQREYIVHVTDGISLPILFSQLYLRKEQQVIFKRTGIFKINSKDIWNTTKRGDIIIQILLTE